ncbi:cytochrome b5-like heme/steroid binding domain-containing protein [Aspergillus bertholletiae]|uniref:Cytochrome b5-like heme/steroid binding domain-containing protein n=1 Tax=Aspergillus bertholletiae TaxID=1226010 RepID=A0A5N7B416_9EURO|nr:cytochrome b5-like heme/steroid binding domain-containing protein [Aspergillus bertholletiae]
MSSATTTQLSESITIEQLADHNTLQSLWIAVHGRVYDLTTFSADHPGGIDALESSAGTDGTEAYEYAGHSQENLVKMQQYCIGRLAGSPEQPPAIPQNPPVRESKPVRRSPTFGLRQLDILPSMKVAVTLIATCFVTVPSYRYLLSALDVSQLQFTTISGQKTGHAFWAGIATASSVSYVVFRYFYKLFLSSLDYKNDVFSFPPTIPRKMRK